jgi:hypothetical protein
MIKHRLVHTFGRFGKAFPLFFDRSLWYQITFKMGKDHELISGVLCEWLSVKKLTAVVLDKVKSKELNCKLLPRRQWFGVGLGLVILLAQGLMALPAGAQAEANPGIFFARGQAIADPHEPSNSRQEAIQDLQAQAVIQATAVLLSSAQLEKQLQLIQEKVLKQPERYVQTSQIFLENPNQGGLYRVTGQVSVAMDRLKKELDILGLLHQEAETIQPSVPPGPSQGSSSMEAMAESGKAREGMVKAPVSGQEILWAVAEKWDDEWYLPSDRSDPKGLFAACVLQGSLDYGWSLRLPQMETLALDLKGEIPASQVLAQGKALGLSHAVSGTLALVEGADGEGRLQAVLRLLSVSSGKIQGEIHRELGIGDSSNQEAALELADLLIPQLDRQLRAPPPSGETTENVVKPSEAGELVLQIRSKDAYGDWLAMEKTIREQFKSLQVKGFEIRSGQSVVRLYGVDEASLRGLHGTNLPNGAQVQIVSLDGENHAFVVTFLRAGTGPAEPRP